MITTQFQLDEVQYLFTFQDETKLWISKEFIEKYNQLPFYDIIKNSEKYEDDSYYIDMPSSTMEKVIRFLLAEDKNISSLDFKESYDIYKIIYEFSVTADNSIQKCLLFHIKELFIDYLNENNYVVYNKYDIFWHSLRKLNISIELFSLEKKKICMQGLFTPKRKDELFYYSILFKMMNVTTVEIESNNHNNIDSYASNIPIEYICPKYIKDIFPSLESLTITINIHYKKSEFLLKPNSDEYIMEYARLFDSSFYTLSDSEEYEYFTRSEMNEYNTISSLDLNKLYYSHDLVYVYKRNKENNKLPKLYKYFINEGINTNHYLHVEMNGTTNEYTLFDRISIEYDEKTNDKTLCINELSSQLNTSQLIQLSTYMCSSNIMINTNFFSTYEAMAFMKALEDSIFDSLKILSVRWIKELTFDINKNLYIKIMTTHLFPNVTELIYNEEYFELSSIKKECFPKLHIINIDIKITHKFVESLIPVNLISMIDTIRIKEIESDQKKEIALQFDNLAYIYSIYIDGIDDLIYYCPHIKELLENSLISIHKLTVDTSDFVNIKKLDYFKNYKQNIDFLDIKLKVDYNISIKYLKSISNIFNNNKINTIHKLTINLNLIQKDLSSEYLNIYEKIMEKLIPKASFVKIEFINDIPNDNFLELYTTDNLPKLEYIELCKRKDKKWWIHFIQRLINYIYKNNFPLSTTIRLNNSFIVNDYYIYDPNSSIFRYKYENHTYINTIIGTKNKLMNEYEIETLFDCDTISDKQIKIYEQKLNDSSFIQENSVDYEF
ncbi:hypothetical protein WA158_007731 [Blastocystis sp. Blastoise]